MKGVRSYTEQFSASALQFGKTEGNILSNFFTIPSSERIAFEDNLWEFVVISRTVLLLAHFNNRIVKESAAIGPAPPTIPIGFENLTFFQGVSGLIFTAPLVRTEFKRSATISF